MREAGDAERMADDDDDAAGEPGGGKNEWCEEGEGEGNANEDEGTGGGEKADWSDDDGACGTLLMLLAVDANDMGEPYGAATPSAPAPP